MTKLLSITAGITLVGLLGCNITKTYSEYDGEVLKAHAEVTDTNKDGKISSLEKRYVIDASEGCPPMEKMLKSNDFRRAIKNY